MRGRNSVTVHASEPGIWVVLVQIARKRSSNQVGGDGSGGCREGR